VSRLGSQRRRALLVRIGIDSTYGEWNAPVDADTGEFVYVPIPESQPQLPGLETDYRRFAAATAAMGVPLPARLVGKATHLDPDFDQLTFGDQGQRAARIGTLKRDDLIVFYAGLRSVGADRSLVYALIGLYVVDEVLPAQEVAPDRRGQNAHTRRAVPNANGDIIVRAQAKTSGRLQRCLPIGEYRDRAYRVRRDLLARWGGLSVKDGYIHRSVYLPEFEDVGPFEDWFSTQRPTLVARNLP